MRIYLSKKCLECLKIFNFNYRDLRILKFDSLYILLFYRNLTILWFFKTSEYFFLTYRLKKVVPVK
jgi:hypothetical protein